MSQHMIATDDNLWWEETYKEEALVIRKIQVMNILVNLARK